RCLAVSPLDRYPSAEALADDLQRFLEGRELRVAVNPSKRELAVNWAWRNRLKVAFAVVMVIVLVQNAYRPVVRALYPIEKLEAFHSAIADVDQGRDAEAVEPLKNLVDWYP